MESSDHEDEKQPWDEKCKERLKGKEKSIGAADSIEFQEYFSIRT